MSQYFNNDVRHWSISKQHPNIYLTITKSNLDVSLYHKGHILDSWSMVYLGIGTFLL